MKARTYRIEDRATLMRVAGSLSNMLVSADKPLMVEVSDYREQRSTAQNRLLHAILRDVAENVEVNGKRFSQDAWKEQFRRQFIGTEEITLPTGEIVDQGISTTTLNKGQMVEAMDRFLAWLAHDFGYMAQELAA